MVKAIKPLAKSTNRRGVSSKLGGFGAIFDIMDIGYNDPVLVAGTDGVGTKLRVAIESGKHDTVGIDLVAMCVNDVIVQGAEPLFFLDYFATGKLDVKHGIDVITGIADGCKRAGCALIGGETAEMPDMYSKKDYDLAGFCVGAVERENILTGNKISEGNVILGIASSGLHSNGFSLVRKIIKKAGLTYSNEAPFQPSLTLAEALLVPTKIYVEGILAAIKTGGICGLAHITGGGLLDNIPRILPNGLGVEIDAKKWVLPSVFKWLAKEGNITVNEMARTFNCGIGMIVIVEKSHAEFIKQTLIKCHEQVSTIGRIVKCKTNEVIIANTENQWLN